MCLEEGDWSAGDLSREMGVKEKEILAHLPHVERSARGSGRKLVIVPAVCMACGHVFEGRRRFTRPGRCPRCRATRVASPHFRIE